MGEQNKNDDIIQQALSLYREGKSVEKQSDEDYSCWATKVYNFSKKNLFNSEFEGNMTQLNGLTVFDRALKNNRKNHAEILGTLKGIGGNIMQMYDNTFKGKSIFISHQSNDIEIVKSLIKYLKYGMDVSRQNIFCTCGNLGTRTIGPGENLCDKLQDELRNNTKIFIAVITDNYMQSKICLMELGAAWGLGCEVIPILVSKDPDILAECIKLLNGIFMITFTNESTANKQLDGLKNKVIDMLSLPNCQDTDDYKETKEDLIKTIQKVM